MTTRQAAALDFLASITSGGGASTSAAPTSSPSPALGASATIANESPSSSNVTLREGGELYAPTTQSHRTHLVSESSSEAGTPAKISGTKSRHKSSATKTEKAHPKTERVKGDQTNLKAVKAKTNSKGDSVTKSEKAEKNSLRKETVQDERSEKQRQQSVVTQGQQSTRSKKTDTPGAENNESLTKKKKKKKKKKKDGTPHEVNDRALSTNSTRSSIGGDSQSTERAHPADISSASLPSATTPFGTVEQVSVQSSSSALDSHVCSASTRNTATTTTSKKRSTKKSPGSKAPPSTAASQKPACDVRVSETISPNAVRLDEQTLEVTPGSGASTSSSGLTESASTTASKPQNGTKPDRLKKPTKASILPKVEESPKAESPLVPITTSASAIATTAASTSITSTDPASQIPPVIGPCLGPESVASPSSASRPEEISNEGETDTTVSLQVARATSAATRAVKTTARSSKPTSSSTGKSSKVPSAKSTPPRSRTRTTSPISIAASTFSSGSQPLFDAESGESGSHEPSSEIHSPPRSQSTSPRSGMHVHSPVSPRASTKTERVHRPIHSASASAFPMASAAAAAAAAVSSLSPSSASPLQMTATLTARTAPTPFAPTPSVVPAALLYRQPLRASTDLAKHSSQTSDKAKRFESADSITRRHHKQPIYPTNAMQLKKADESDPVVYGRDPYCKPLSDWPTEPTSFLLRTHRWSLPFSAISISPFVPSKNGKRREKVTGTVEASVSSDNLIGAQIPLGNGSSNKRRHKNKKEVNGVSCRRLLHSEWLACDGQTDSSSYHPDFLDDPTLTTGKHLTMLPIPGHRIAVLHFVKKKALKGELNDQFRERHENINWSISLTKIRKVKRKLLDIGLSQRYNLSTVAHAYVLFEKLVLQNKVTKENRYVVGGACLLISMKWNEDKSTSKKFIRSNLDAMEKSLSVSKERILLEEMRIYVDLSFGVFLPVKVVASHLERITVTLESKDDFNLKLGMMNVKD